MISELALIKLGGSIITNKDVPLSANFSAITRIVKTLSHLRIPIILVHGGGSFGHYWSLKYDMHSAPKAYDPHGIGVVHSSMITLNRIIIESMLDQNMNPYSLPPTGLVLNNRPILKKILELSLMAKAKITPVTFGDIVYRNHLKFSILSGDELMTLIATVLKPTRIIFALNVDGIYNNMQDKQLVQVFENKNPVKFLKVKADVTGGMVRKVREALKISKLGLDVWLVNGLKPERIAKILHNEKPEGTVIKGKKGIT